VFQYSQDNRFIINISCILVSQDLSSIILFAIHLSFQYLLYSLCDNSKRTMATLSFLKNAFTVNRMINNVMSTRNHFYLTVIVYGWMGCHYLSLKSVLLEELISIKSRSMCDIIKKKVFNR